MSKLLKLWRFIAQTFSFLLWKFKFTKSTKNSRKINFIKQMKMENVRVSHGSVTIKCTVSQLGMCVMPLPTVPTSQTSSSVPKIILKHKLHQRYNSLIYCPKTYRPVKLSFWGLHSVSFWTFDDLKTWRWYSLEWTA